MKKALEYAKASGPVLTVITALCGFVMAWGTVTAHLTNVTKIQDAQQEALKELDKRQDKTDAETAGVTAELRGIRSDIQELRVDLRLTRNQVSK